MRYTTAALVVLLASSAHASEQDAKLARFAWTAFECHELALIADNQPEGQRLYGLGIVTSRRFVDAVRAGKVSDHEMINFVPGGIAQVTDGGPSVDFVVGRIYQIVATYTFEKVTKEDSSGKALPPEKWVVDPVEMKGIAQTKYRKANCELIK